MTLSENICLALNKVFPYKKRLVRNSPLEYIKVQMNWAEDRYKLIGPYMELEGKSVLDAGCGTGGKTFVYSKKGVAKIVGVDLSQESITAAIGYFGEASNIEFLCESLSNLHFEDNTFDYVILNDVVEHIERPILEAALVELKRVVKPTGMILLEFPPWTSHDASHLYEYISMPWCQLFFSDRTLINVVKKVANDRGDSIKHIEKLIQDFGELNRITYKESGEMFKRLNFKIIRHDRWVFFHWNFLRYIPFFNNFVTKRVFAILGK